VVVLDRIRGLSSAAPVHLADLDVSTAHYYEAVLGANSPLLGRPLKAMDFRSHYQGVVMAIQRSGNLVDRKLGNLLLHLGDTLLVLADPGFGDRWRDRRDFLLIQDSGHTPPVRGRRSLLVGLIALAIVVLASTGILPILQASLLGALALLAVGALSPTE